MSAIRSLLTLAAAALLLSAPAAPAAAVGGPPEAFDDPFAFTGPDFTNGFVVFINTTRDEFCTSEQVAREQAIVDWIEGGMVDPFPEWALERPAGIETWTPQLIATPKGTIGRLSVSDQVIELWWLDDEIDAPGVGACLDTDDRSERFAVGTADVRAMVTDFFGEGLRAASLDRFSGTADLVGDDGHEYGYRFLWHQLLPCTLDPGPRCELARFTLTPQ
ncbi:hypothetical protein [Agromyces sp. M3QZ16-3]|uniref:hypothetical protein n=1 Tax=Agromyces sp. M3QZ16-3 TaxID=3447585 RepID=UPI003F69384B